MFTTGARRTAGRRSLGREFGWLWTAYAISAYGSGLGFGALAFVAILELNAGPAEVSALAAAGLAVGALVAVPLGPWVEFRRKRPVMIAMDLARFAALISIPVTYALGWLTFVQLLVVAVVVAAAKIAFNAASGAYLKTLVPPQDLLVANGRFESTTWSATAVGPPLGGAAVGLLGPVTTVVIDAVSHLLSALGIRAIGGREPHPDTAGAARRGLAAGELLEGWRCILAHPGLRLLFFNALLVNGLIMAAEPPLAVLMLDDLGFAPWQYGLAFTGHPAAAADDAVAPGGVSASAVTPSARTARSRRPSSRGRAPARSRPPAASARASRTRSRRSRACCGRRRRRRGG